LEFYTRADDLQEIPLRFIKGADNVFGAAFCFVLFPGIISWTNNVKDSLLSSAA